MEDVQKDAETCASSIKVGSKITLSFLNQHFHKLVTKSTYRKTQNNKVIHCSVCFQDYELQLASYSSGLETLLKIPIKRTMLQSPASVVRQEV